MFCTRCGAKNDDGAKFCTACGAPLRPMPASAPTPGAPGATDGASNPSSSTDATAASTPANTSPTTPQPTSASEDAQHRTDTPAPRRRGKKGLVIAGVAAVAVVAVIAGIAVFLLLNASRSISLDSETFPDASVLAAVSAFDTDGDGKLSSEEADAVTDLTITDAQSISGLGVFSRLANLVASGQNLSSADLSDVSGLVTVDFSNSPALTEVALPGTSSLTSINISGTSVSQVDLGGMDNLESFDATSTAALESVDFGDTSHLSHVSVENDTQVTGIEASGLRAVWAPTSANNGDGNVAFVNRDDLGRPISLEIPGDYGDYQATYTYDDQGRLATVSIDDTTYTAVYDDDGKLIMLSAPYNPAFDSDAQIEVEGLGMVNAGSTIYYYDDAGNFSCTGSAMGGSEPACTYDEAGHLVSRGLSTLSTTMDEWVYDDAGRMSTYITKVDSNDIDKVELTYNEHGVATGATFYTDGMLPGAADESASLLNSAGGFAQVSIAYEADDTGRIVSGSADSTEMFGPEMGSVDTVDFEYDAAGNLVSAVVNHDQSGSQDVLSMVMNRYFIPEDAEDPEPVIQLVPTYTDDLAAITYYTLPCNAPEGFTYAIDRADFTVL